MPDLKAVLIRHLHAHPPIASAPVDGHEVRAHIRSLRRLVTIVAVSVVLAAAVGFQLLRGPAPGGPAGRTPVAGPSPGRSVDLHPGSTQTVAPGSSQGPISADSSASCVERYDLTTLRQRAFAFDGTVTRIAVMQPPKDGSGALAGYRTVTFTVHQWFRGGDPSTVSVDMMSASTKSSVSSADATTYGVGTRLLVSGEPRYGGSPLQAPVAWSCGFTRNADRLTTESWRQTFNRG